MIKRYAFLVLLFLIGFNGFSQQESDLNDYLPLKVVAAENIFINRKDINPAFSNDSARIDASVIGCYQTVGYENSPRKYTFSVDSKIPNTKSSLGFEIISFQNVYFKEQMLKVNYGYNFDIGEKSKIKSGINLSISRFKYDYQVLEVFGIDSKYSNWSYYHNVDLGLSYCRLNHTLGVSYQGLFKSYIKSGSSEYYIADRVLIVNYLSTYKLSSSLKVNPELIVYNNIQETNILLKGDLLYRNKYSVGFFVDKSANFSIMLRGALFNYFELVYIYEHWENKNYSNDATHVLKLGITL